MSVSAHRYTVLDVFTDVPLEGNPVAVFDDGTDLSDELMQRTARELNLSETVFLLAPSGRANARARIFTPSLELPFAGHPVLGTAFLIGQRSGSDSVTLETGAGPVPVALRWDGDRVVYGEMEQPIPSAEPFSPAEGLLAALGLSSSGLPIEGYRNGPLHVYVELADEAAVAALEPDMGALAALDGAFGVSCFAGAGDGRRFKTRMFGPSVGVPEDPATGSAAGPLALHLARHGRIDYGREIEIRQGAEIGRPSLLRARVDGRPGHVERVVVGGGAVAVAQGEYRLR
ncbi:MAG: PhzF family phenazine biosynthesis protein [Solirubrobacterales bacterium]|nr:PhzF family phenazine biosynthesis protein [Solirubrobacterales bacterium]MBV9714379.1 PhzF family phenazine biosynthesis protein [Solirubrobacterales bacterium]